METKIESKVGKLNGSIEKAYNFLSDFKNFSHLIPADKIKNWQATEDNCSFTIEGIGEAGLRIIEKNPFSLIKISGAEGSKINFTFWIQLKEVATDNGRIKLTLKADMNPMLKMIASKPIQNFIDSLVDQLGKMPFNQSNVIYRK